MSMVSLTPDVVKVVKVIVRLINRTLECHSYQGRHDRSMQHRQSADLAASQHENL